MRDRWLKPEAVLLVVMVVLLTVFVVAGLYVALRERNSVVVPMASSPTHVVVPGALPMAVDYGRTLD